MQILNTATATCSLIIFTVIETSFTLPCGRLASSVIQFTYDSIDTEQSHRIIRLNKNCHEQAINHDIFV